MFRLIRTFIIEKLDNNINLVVVEVSILEM